MNIFDALIYQPLFNVLILFYHWLGDFGFAVIALTVAIRILLYPLAAKAIRAQKATVRIQPRMKDIQKKYKDDKERQALEMMALWRENKINPLSGFLLLLVQIPVLWGLYRVFLNGFKNESLAMLYGFVANPGSVDPMFLGHINLAASLPAFAVVAGVLQFVQTKMMTPSVSAAASKEKSQNEQFAEMMQKQMLYIFPAITVAIFWALPSALGLYWLASGAFSIGQQYYILKKNGKN